MEPARQSKRRHVSPDERFVAGVVDSARRRATRVASAEAFAIGALTASLAFAMASLAAVPNVARLGSTAAVWTAITTAVFLRRRRQTRRSAIVRALEHANSASRNLLFTAHELSTGDLTAAPSVRARVFADAATVSRTIDPATVFSSGRFSRLVAFAGAAWLIVVGALVWGAQVARLVPKAISGTAGPSGIAAGVLHVTVAVEPPPYTRLPPQTLEDPAQIQVVEGSTVTVTRSGSPRRVLARATMARTGYMNVEDGADRRIIPVVVSPDALPSAKITAPARDLVYSGGNPRLAFETRASDDFGLRSLTLHFTKVSGSGEQFDFQDGEIPLTIARDNPREWRGSATRTLGELNLKDGDMFVYRAVAADSRPGDGSASSDAYFIEISRLGAGAGDAFTLPEEETKYALSQQMLIIKTDRLIQRRASMSASGLEEAALNLAVEQRMIRAEFVFMLGGEIEDEEVEAEQSSELQEGRMQNRGQRDLREATVAMSRAEKLLTGVNLPDALAAERAAVTALQRAFVRDRYILRALASRTNLDPTRRLTGNVSEARDWRRLPASAAGNRRAAVLQDLLNGIASLKTSSAGGDAQAFRSRAQVMAEQALRIDPASAPLRHAATELQRAADASDSGTRTRALTAAALASSLEARRSTAIAPLAVPGDAALSGALSDAARSTGAARR
jgi:hypothetical protein